jgi:hypothetical protein
MSGMLVRVRATLTLRTRWVRNPVSGRRERLDRAALGAAAANLTQTRQLLSAEVNRGLTMVRSLNANTAHLKHSIRDNCGDRAASSGTTRSKNAREPAAVRNGALLPNGNGHAIVGLALRVIVLSCGMSAVWATWVPRLRLRACGLLCHSLQVDLEAEVRSDAAD